MTIEIGNKPLKEITKEQLIKLVMIEGCCASPEFWNDPVIVDFNNTLFSNTVTIDYVSYRKKDNLKSVEITFFFKHEDFYFHYVRENERDSSDWQPNHKNLKLASIRYLIQEGFDIPLY